MTELLTAAQMRAIEAAAIASGEVTGLELMERAGRGVVEAIFDEWPELSPSWGPTPKPPEYLLQDDEEGKHRTVVLCGPGNNGGDGFVVARLLHEAGWGVEVFLYGDAEKLPPDAKVNYERWCEVGEIEALINFDAWAGEYDLGIDALFGTGLARAIDIDAAKIANNLGAIGKVLAVDIPSGICADSGRVLVFGVGGVHQPQVCADLTVTFQFSKCGHILDAGSELCGKLVITDIGINRDSSLRDLGIRPGKKNRNKRIDLTIAPRLIPRWWYGRDGNWSWLGKGGEGNPHKYSHGHALILSGGIGKGGAARLASRGALRIGAGAVTVGCPEDALVENAAQLNAVMLTAVNDAEALEGTLEDARINALCIGPGLGLGAREAALVASVLESGRAAVLDADALTLLAGDAGLFANLHRSCVLTPHAGEFARLFPDLAEKLNAPATTGPAYSKVDATREAAKRAGCVVLFKGPDTVIADANGRCSINASVYERAAPWLATAGSGDALAGFITGLLARGFAPMQAAETGAWLHTECAIRFGPGLIAEDLPEQLPRVMRDLKI